MNSADIALVTLIDKFENMNFGINEIKQDKPGIRVIIRNDNFSKKELIDFIAKYIKMVEDELYAYDDSVTFDSMDIDYNKRIMNLYCSSETDRSIVFAVSVYCARKMNQGG